jgi:hypothetical protein
MIWRTMIPINREKFKPLLASDQGCVKVARNVRFSGRHGDLPLRKPVGDPSLTSVVADPFLLIS